MGLIGRILLGLFVTAVGILMAYKTEWVLAWFGRNAWAERFFGWGGTRFLYKLIGILIAILGLLIVTDLWERVIGEFLLNILIPSR